MAKCITLERCNTNGDSGTFVDEQNGASASATDLTAYSCSSKSLEDFASDAASAKSLSSFPVFRIVPARTLDVTNDLLNLTKSSGVAPTKPSTRNSQVEGYSISSLCNKPRVFIATVDAATWSLANTTFSNLFCLIESTAKPT